MVKYGRILGITIALILLASLAFVSIAPPRVRAVEASPSPAWWNNSWAYRKAITISGSQPENYQINDNYRITYTSPPIYPAYIGNGTVGFAIGQNGLQDDSQSDNTTSVPRLIYAPAYGSTGYYTNRGWGELGQVAHYVDSGSGLSESISNRSSYSQTLDIYNATVKTSITFNNSLKQDILAFVPLKYDNIVVIHENYSGNDALTAAIKFDTSSYGDSHGDWSMTPSKSSSLTNKEIKCTFTGLGQSIYMVIKMIHGNIMDNGSDNLKYQTSGSYTFVIALDNISVSHAESQIQTVQSLGYSSVLAAHESSWHMIWANLSDIENIPSASLWQNYIFQQYYLMSSVTPEHGMNSTGLGESGWALTFWDYSAWMHEGLLTSGYNDENSFIFYYNTLSTGLAGTNYGFCQDWFGNSTDTSGEVHGAMWIGLGAWQLYTMTGDLNWLQNYGYPIMKSITNLIENFTTFASGKGWEFNTRRYGSVDEYRGSNNVHNPTELAAGAKVLSKATEEASIILGVDNSHRAKWENLYENMYLPTTSSTYGTVYQSSSDASWQPRKHPVQGEMIYPAQLVNEDDPLAISSLNYAYDNLIGSPYYDHYSAARWALLEAGDNALSLLNSQLGAFKSSVWYFPTEHADTSFYVTTSGSYVLSINKMLAHTQNPYNQENMIIEVFTGTPGSWLNNNVSFENIRTDGALINSASYTPTKVSLDMSILIDNAVKVRVKVPSGWTTAYVKKDNVVTSDYTFDSVKHIVTVNNVWGTVIDITENQEGISKESIWKIFIVFGLILVVIGIWFVVLLNKRMK